MRSYHSRESLNLVALEVPASVRGTFPRYSVVADGRTVAVKSTKALDRLLGVIYADLPLVFRNAGKGVTIDFDRS